MKKNILGILLLSVAMAPFSLSASEARTEKNFVAFSQAEQDLLRASRNSQSYILLGKKEEALIRYSNDVAKSRCQLVKKVLENYERNIRLVSEQEYELLLEEILAILSPRDPNVRIDPMMIDRLFDAAEYTGGYSLKVDEQSEEPVYLFLCRGDKNEHLATDRIHLEGMHNFLLTRTRETYIKGTASLRQFIGAVQTTAVSGLPNPITGAIDPLEIDGIAELPDELLPKEVTIGNEHRVGVVRIGKLCESAGNQSGIRVNFSAVPQTGVYIKCIISGGANSTAAEQSRVVSLFFRPSLSLESTPSPSISVFDSSDAGGGIYLLEGASDFGNLLSTGIHLLILFSIDGVLGGILDRNVISYKILGQNITTVVPDIEPCS